MELLTIAAIAGLILVAVFYHPKPKPNTIATVAAPLIADPQPSGTFFNTLKGGTAGAYAKIDAACEDDAVSENLKALFRATKHLVKHDDVTVAPAVPNPPPASTIVTP